MGYFDYEQLRSTTLRTFTWMMGCLGAGCMLVGTLTSPASAQGSEADTLFAVTVVDKSSEHPHYNDGFPEGYTIDGQEGRELTLERGQTYYFVMEGVPDHHPFYITTNEDGGGQGAYTNGVTSTLDNYNDRAYGQDSQDTLKFTPGDDAPELLYYNCTAHTKMGYQLNIVDPTSTNIDDAVAGQQLPQSFVLRGNYPNPFNPSTTIHFDLPASANVQVEIYDMLGRPVETFTPGRMSAGANRSVQVDASSFASGVYLYRVRAVTANDEMTATGRMMLVK